MREIKPVNSAVFTTKWLYYTSQSSVIRIERPPTFYINLPIADFWLETKLIDKLTGKLKVILFKNKISGNLLQKLQGSEICPVCMLKKKLTLKGNFQKKKKKRQNSYKITKF